MAKQLAIAAILGSLLSANSVCACLKAETSEGRVDLHDGQIACAPLRHAETVADKGRRFVTCTNGILYEQECPANLRFDTKTGICNWPTESTCETMVLPRGPPPTLPSLPPRPTRTPPTGECSAANCQLPHCSCIGSRPYISPLESQPMFIILSFDGRMSSYYFDQYFKPLMVNSSYSLFNPSRCKSKFAFFLCHENTDYAKVTKLWEAGHEIAVGGLNCRLPAGLNHADYAAAVEEIIGMKEEILRGTGNRFLVDTVKGFRAPNLHMAYNAQFDVLSDYNFKYDSSILNIIGQGNELVWPFTLDFPVSRCGNSPCPTNHYPGLWEIRLNSWIGDDQVSCNRIDACTVGTSRWMASEQQWYDFFKRHFETYFYPTKTPMPISVPTDMFDKYIFFSALIRWLRETLQTRRDVWLVTPQQLLSWTEYPVGNADMEQQNWGC